MPPTSRRTATPSPRRATRPRPHRCRATPAGLADPGDSAASRSIRNANRADANQRPGAQNANRLDTCPRRPEPPPQPSEFQKFVQTATGRLLPVFGSRFFIDAAKLDEAKEGPALQQVDVAMPPDHKSKPSVALIAIASTLLGFLGSTAFVLTRRYMAWSRELYPQDAQAHADMLKAWRWRG